MIILNGFNNKNSIIKILNKKHLFLNSFIYLPISHNFLLNLQNKETNPYL